jgi:hypothetical protein
VAFYLAVVKILILVIVGLYSFGALVLPVRFMLAVEVPISPGEFLTNVSNSTSNKII